MSQLLQMRRVKVTARWKPEIKQKYMHKKKRKEKNVRERHEEILVCKRR